MKRILVVVLALALIALVGWRIRDFAAEETSSDSATGGRESAPGTNNAAPEASLEGRAGQESAVGETPSTEPPEPVLRTASLVLETVVVQTGTNLADVAVFVVDTASRRHEGRTDESGRVEFDGITHGAAQVWGVHAGWVTRSLEVDVREGPNESKLYLLPSAAVRGRVLDAARGAPVTGARVIAGDYVSSGLDARTGIDGVWAIEETDGRGGFLLDRVPKNERLCLTVLAAGYARTIRRVEIQAGGPTAREIVLRLHPGTELRGKVVDRRGQAVGGAAVYVYPPGDDTLSIDPREGYTDGVRVILSLAGRANEEGRFEIGGLALDTRYGATAFAAGHPRAEDVVGLHVSADGVVPDARLVVPDGAQLEITVRDEQGVPIDGAEVTSGSEFQIFRGVGSQAVDAEGRVVLFGLDAGESKVQADATGYLSETQTVVLAEGEVKSIQFRLRRGAEITGVVVDPEGLPLAGVRVRARPEEDGSSCNAMSDEEGRFHLVGIAPGPVQVEVASRGHALATPLTVDAPASDVRLECISATVVSARLRLPPGLSAPPHIRVGVSEASGAGWSGTRPWNEGRIRVSPRSGPRILRIQGVDFAPVERSIQVETGKTLDLGDIPLSSGVSLRGRVVDAHGGPIRGAMVTAVEHEWRAAQTGADGRFELEHLASKAVWLDVKAEGYVQRWYTVAASALTRAHRIELVRGGLLQLRVLDAEGQPVIARWVTIQPADMTEDEDVAAYNARSAWGGTDDQGRLEVRLVPGAYRIEVDLQVEASVVGEATLEEGGTTTLTLRP